MSADAEQDSVWVPLVQTLLFVTGLVVGYLGSGAVLGPGVLSVLIGLLLGAALALLVRRFKSA